jgi:integrating conjugative element protein (TIGR03759 family)
MKARWIALLLTVITTHQVLAETVITTQIPQPVIKTQDQALGDAAARWGLTTQQWVAYEQIMRDRRGVWSPGLDPITALGVSVDTASERKHYAQLYVRTEFERTRKELAFQLAVDRAWARLYPDTPRIGRQSTAVQAHQPTVRYALIVKPQCTECESVLAQRLGGMIREAQEGVDIHVVGTGGNDNALNRWITSQPALLAALKDGRATVNHGSQFQDLESFPAIYSKAGNGQWTREL